MATLDTKYYEDMYDLFLMMFPMWETRVVSYQPRSTYSIRVLLDNGDRVEFNGMDRTIRKVSRDAVNSAEDITDDCCRSIFAANLSEQMRMTGIGQAILAESTGLSSAIISKYLNKKSTPSLTNVKRIARALNCSVAELIG